MLLSRQEEAGRRSKALLLRKQGEDAVEDARRRRSIWSKPRGPGDDLEATALEVAQCPPLGPEEQAQMAGAAAGIAKASLALWRPHATAAPASPKRLVTVSKAAREKPPYVGLEEVRNGAEVPTFELTEGVQIEQGVRTELAELRLLDLRNLAARHGLWSAPAPEPAKHLSLSPSRRMPTGGSADQPSVGAIAGSLVTSLGLAEDHVDTRCLRCREDTARGHRGALARCSRCPPERERTSKGERKGRNMNQAAAVSEVGAVADAAPVAAAVEAASQMHEIMPAELREQLTALLMPALISEEKARRRQSVYDAAHRGEIVKPKLHQGSQIHSRQALFNPAVHPVQPATRPYLQAQHTQRDGERCAWCENMLKTDRTSCLPEGKVGERIREERPNLPTPISFYWLHNDCYLAAGAGQPRIVPRN